jgi:Dolichyl-phosphate-mannose-protein mannosyltransferase
MRMALTGRAGLARVVDEARADSRVIQLLNAAVLLIAAAYIAAFVGTGALRALYPYPLDGLEPGVLVEVKRILAGQAIYVAPSLGYVPYIYGPGFFYTAAVFARLIGPSMTALRTVSLLASIASICLVVAIVRRETGNVAAGLIGGGLFAACATLADHDMDTARMDALMVAILLAAVYAARYALLSPRASWRSAALCGTFCALALLTKQSSVPAVLVLLVAFVILRRAQTLPFVAALATVLGVPLVLLTAQTGGWAAYYVWDLPRRHMLSPELVGQFWPDVLGKFTLPLFVAPVYLVGRWLDGDRRRALFYGVVTIGMVGMAWGQRINVGGGLNVELPAFAAVSLLFGLSLDEALKFSTAPAFRGYVLFLAIAPFLVLVYNPRLVVPYRSDVWAGDRLTATLSALPGPVFAGSLSAYVADSSGAVEPELGAIYEVMGGYADGKLTPEGSQWLSEYRAALAAQRFTYVLVDPSLSQFFVAGPAKDNGYVDVGPLFPPSDEFFLWRTGWLPQPELLVRKDLVGVPLPLGGAAK